MPMALFFLTFGGAVAIALLYPHLRVIAIAVAALCAALLAYIVYDQTSEPQRDATRLTPQDIVLTDVTLEEGPRYLSLNGWIENTSGIYTVRSVNLRTRFYDCPTLETDITECPAIGEETGIARVNIPAGQTRPFKATLGFRDVATPRGVLRWDHEVSSVRATDDR
jgi:hypothetical protein